MGGMYTYDVPTGRGRGYPKTRQSKGGCVNYREVNKGLYVVAKNFFLLLLNCSARPCLGPA